MLYICILRCMCMFSGGETIWTVPHGRWIAFVSTLWLLLAILGLMAAPQDGLNTKLGGLVGEKNGALESFLPKMCSIWSQGLEVEAKTQELITWNVQNMQLRTSLDRCEECRTNVERSDTNGTRHCYHLWIVACIWFPNLWRENHHGPTKNPNCTPNAPRKSHSSPRNHNGLLH